MKKSILLVTVLLASVNVSFSQLGYGAKGGINFTTFGGKDAGSPDSRMGIALGGFLTYNLVELFTLQPELLYTTKGAVYKGFIGGTPATSTVSGSYLEIPVVVKLNIPLAGVKSFFPNIYVGPALGFLLSAKVKTEVGSQTQETDIKNTTKGTDFGFILGTSVDVPLSFGKFAIDLRYNLGLTSTDDTAAKADVVNRAFYIMIGFTISH